MAEPGKADPTEPPVDEPSRFFVGGLHRQITPHDVEEYFSQFGEVESFRLKLDSSGHTRGFGWLQFVKPPTGVMRPEPHVLNNAKLTVEVAHAFPASKGHGSYDQSFTNSYRRRPRSGSLSSDRSVSSSDSRERYSGQRRRFSPRQARRGGTESRRSRLPPLPTPAFVAQSQAAGQLPTAPPAYESGFGPSTNTGNGGEALLAAMTAAAATTTPTNDVYLCIPLALCPSQFLNDPRTFCAKLDQSRIGGLSIVPTPTSGVPGLSTQLCSAGAPAVQQTTMLPPPPPPPPPPPSSKHHSSMSRAGGRSHAHGGGKHAYGE
ncbi:putative RNA recognition motif (a k a RRM RBD or RNP domain) [Trypanosoma vivax]|uniref:Putative RNA-binding protein n=1 Tax=Trypanosoma vivax (strain Y486) TaxID=1055687 RepID=G0U043_TRYVY|nr:putative RNA recognition motif (a k a RRM RBD or RNP domain) [Trypanosoma vivax]CCC49440.1 putative RNA-binding protein [Trypanosoma vivax Y486]